MENLFQFEDGVPMRFFVVSGSHGNLPDTIETLGGEMGSPFHAHFSLIDDGKDVTLEMLHLPAQLVDIRWVQQSKSAGRIQPIYAYLREASPGSHKDGLADLGESARDAAELVKALVDLNGAFPDREMYEILHRKYPHQTSQQWESLYEGNGPKIDTAVAVVKADLEKKLDDCITFLLCGQMEEGEEGTLMMDEEDTLFTREDNMEIEEEEDSVPTKDAIPDGDATDDHDLTSLSGSSADGEAEIDDEFPGPIPILKQKRSRGRGRGPGSIQGNQRFKYTDAELDAMAGFLVEQGLTHKIAGIQYWKLFCQQDASRSSRTPDALRAHYGRHRAELNKRALALSKDGNRQQPEHQEEAVSTSGGTVTSTAQQRHDEEQPLPLGWEMFRSERYKGTPFYHHAASATSFWKLSEVFKFSESRGETVDLGGISSEMHAPGSY